MKLSFLKILTLALITNLSTSFRLPISFLTEYTESKPKILTNMQQEESLQKITSGKLMRGSYKDGNMEMFYYFYFNCKQIGRTWRLFSSSMQSLQFHFCRSTLNFTGSFCKGGGDEDGWSGRVDERE